MDCGVGGVVVTFNVTVELFSAFTWLSVIDNHSFRVTGTGKGWLRRPEPPPRHVEYQGFPHAQAGRVRRRGVARRQGKDEAMRERGK